MALQHVGSTAPVNPAVYDTNSFDDFNEFAAPAPLAVQPSSHSPIVVRSNQELYQSLSAKGFSGLKSVKPNWRDEPMISLKTDGMFEDATGQNFGKEFTAQIIGGRPKYAWSFVGSTDPKANLAYTYQHPKIPDDDGITWEETQIETTKKKEDGSVYTLAEFRAIIEGKGKELVPKTYFELDVILSSPGTPNDGKEHKLSISPASVPTIISHLKNMERFNITLTHATRFKVGDKIKPTNSPAYYPWVFEIVT